MILDKELKILDKGDALGKMCANIHVGGLMNEVFEIEKNAQVFKDNQIQIKEDALYFVTLKSNGIKFKGQFLSLNEQQFLFACAPLIVAMKDLSTVGLNFMDFPLHDYFTDAMFLLRANDKTMLEIREFSDKIKKSNQDLKLKNDELSLAQELLQRNNEHLEERVRNRTKELEEKNSELSYTIARLQKTQEQLIESTKMAALGQLVAGIAHEINTPIGAIKASIELLQRKVREGLSSVQDLNDVLNVEERKLFMRLTYDIFESENQYSSREQRKMSRALRSRLLEDGIEGANEIADCMGDLGYFNDLSAYYTLFHHPRFKTILNAIQSYGLQDRMADVIQASISKADRVVTALKTYIEGGSNDEISDVDIVESLESVLVIQKNSIKQGVRLVRNFSKDKMILRCNSKGLNQVWLNLIHNALQAMDNKGTLTVSASYFENLLFVSVEDDGPGIPEDISSKIFDPFFTTKTDGQGTGLGLNLVRKIVRQLEGEINVESEPGKTTFTITLPGLEVVKSRKTKSLEYYLS